MSRLISVLGKAAARQPILIAGIGGSITAGAVASSPQNRWLNLLQPLIGNYFGCVTNLWNAGISGTNSDYGALRCDRDISAHAPDIIFVDYAVNDAAAQASSYDSLLRRLMASNMGAAIVPIMFCDNLQRSVQDTLVAICAAYNLPVVSYRDAVIAGIAAGSYTAQQLGAPDGVHLSDLGHSIAAQCVMDLIRIAAPNARAIVPQMPNVFDRTTLISDTGLSAASLSGFVYVPDPGDNPTENVGALMSSAVWDTFSLPITVGAPGNVWLMLAQAPGGSNGTLLAQIDGVNYAVIDTNASPNSQELVQIATGLSPGTHTLKITNWPSASGSAGANLWVCGIGMTA